MKHQKPARMSWPFTKMAVGEQHVFPAEIASKAQLTAHISGRQKGWRFQTWALEDGRMCVERVE